MFLSRNFNYPSRLLSIATKIVVNQCLFTPLFNSYFFGMQAFLAGDNLVEVWERIKRTVPTSLLNSIKVWPLITAINFTWVPIEVSPTSRVWTLSISGAGFCSVPPPSSSLDPTSQ